MTAVLARRLCLDPFVWAISAVPLPILGWLLQPDGMPGWAATALASLATCLALADARRAGIGRVHLSTSLGGHSYALGWKGRFTYLGPAPLCRGLDTSYALFRPLGQPASCPVETTARPAAATPLASLLPVGLALLFAAGPAVILGREMLELSAVEEVSLRPAEASLEAGFVDAASSRLETDELSVTSTLLCRSLLARCELARARYAQARAVAVAVLAGTRELQGASGECVGAAGREAAGVVLQLGDRGKALGRFTREAAAAGLRGPSAEPFVAGRMARWLASQPGAVSAREALEHARRASAQAPRDGATLRLQARLAARLVDSGRTALRLHRPAARPEQVEWAAFGEEAFEAYEAVLGLPPAEAASLPGAVAGDPAGVGLMEELFGLVHATGSRELLDRALQRHGMAWAAGPLRRAVVELAEDLAQVGRSDEAERLLMAAESPRQVEPGLEELIPRAEQLLFRLRSARAMTRS